MKVLQDVERMNKPTVLQWVALRLVVLALLLAVSWFVAAWLDARAAAQGVVAPTFQAQDIYPQLLHTIQVPPPNRFSFTPGETYLFVWDCLPQAFAPVTLAADGSITRPLPCYLENLTVRTVYDDGTLLVVDPDEVKASSEKDATPYLVNPARAISVNVVKSPHRRAA